MTSTNDGKDVKSNQISGPKGKTYFIELYKSLESKLNAECTLRERTQNLCLAWQRIHSLCQHSAPSTHLHLLSWLQRHTAETILQTEWQSLSSKDLHTTLDNAISAFIEECQSISRDGAPPSWEVQLVARGAGFRRMLCNPWGHDVLRVLLDPRGDAPTDQEVLEWLKEERGVVFVTRLRQLATSKCVDLALSLASFVMDRVRATLVVIPDAEQIQDVKEKPKTECKDTFADILKTEAGFTQDVWDLLTDIEFVLLDKGDKRARCIELAKQTPLRNGYQLVDRLQSRLENSPRDKKLWKNAKEVATLIAQVVITRCMVICTCAGVVRSALYWCARALARHLRLRLRHAAAALAAPAASAAHLHTLAAAVHAQSIERNKNAEDMKPFVCELYVRAITAGMNELERLKLKTEKESEARLAEQTLCTWFNHLGILLSTSERFRCECLLTAFSVHPSPAMYERIKAAPPLPPVAVDKHEPKHDETTSEFGSWASDSRSQTNFVKTSETLNLKETKHQANVLSTAILTEGEGLGLSLDLCQDIAVLLSGPRLKTLSWDMDRDLLLENCRTYMERTNFGTRALTTELKFLNLNLRDYDHLPEEDDNENDIYYGIEKGYEHLVEENREPEEIWKDAEDIERTETALSSDTEGEVIIKHKRTYKKKKSLISSDEERDPLSLEPEMKKLEKKKVRPHSKERSIGPNSSKSMLKDTDPLDISEHSIVAYENEFIDVTGNDVPKEKSDKLPKEKKETAPREKKEKVPKEKKERIPKEKKEKVPREKKEKVQREKNKIVKKETPVTSLSNLIGLKINEPRPGVAKTITTSDYHNQTKMSLNSFPSKSHGPNVLFDGIFDTKSPVKTMNKSTDLKSDELSLPNQPVEVKPAFGLTIQHGEFQKPVAPSSTPKRLPNNVWADVLKNDCDNSEGEKPPKIRSNVKTSLSKLIRFRAQRNNRNWSSQPSRPNFHPNTMPSTVNLLHSPSQNYHQVTECPEGFIIPPSDNKPISLKNEHSSISSPYGPVSSTSVSKPQPNTTKVSNTQHLSQYRQDIQKPISKLLLEPPPLRSIKNDLSPDKNNTFEPKLTISPKNLHNFFNELRETINAGTNINSKNQTVTMAPPCTSKPHTPSPQNAKPSIIQKKSENAPNTFSRLSYLHKSKTEIDFKQKKIIDAIIQHQKQSIANRAKVDELNQLIIQHKNMKLKNASKVTADKNTLSIKDTPKASSQNLVKNSSKPSSNPSNIVRHHPIISNSLKVGPNNSRNPISTLDSQSNKQALRSHSMTSTNSSSLTEKDQQDLVSLLRQQSKQNLHHIWPRQKETMRPSSTVVGNTPNLAHPVQTKIKPQNKIHTGPLYGIDKDKLLSNASAKYSNIKNSETKLSQERPVYHIKTDTKFNKNNQNEVQAQSNKNYFDTAKQTDWESVMDTILSLKTPSRETINTKSIDKSNNRLTNQNQAKPDNVNNKNIAEPPSTKSEKTCNVDNSNLNRRETSSHKRTTSLEHSGKQLQNGIRTASVIKNSDQCNEGPETLDILKGHDKCPLSSQQDPFISGLPNTDYDLLEEFELMDDELRQEIGELSSDEENFVAKELLAGATNKTSTIDPVQEAKRMAYPTPSSTNAPLLTTQAATLKKPALKIVESITISRPADPSPLNQPALVGQKSVNIGYKSVQEMTPIIQATNIVHQLPKNIIISTKNGNQTLLVNSEPTIIEPATVVTPQPTALQNVVLIGSEIVYQPCAIRTQIQGALNVQQNSLVSVNALPTVALYQTTRFAAPVINPVIIGNAITTTSNTPSVVQNIPVQNISESMPTLLSESQIEVAVSAVIPEVSQTKLGLNNDTFTEVSNICGELLHQAVDDKTIIHQGKEKIDINSSKNCERKVLSEVQEKLTCADNLETKHKIQRISSDLDQELEIRIDKERLDKKRMAILNRNICHRIKKKPIPLTYAPLFPRKSGAETDLSVLKLKSLVDSKMISVVETNKKNEASKSGKLDKDENSKENESDKPIRRILLRSSNKLAYSDVSAQKINVDEVIANGGKTAKIRLKGVVDTTSTERTLKHRSKSPKANKRKIKKTSVKTTQTRQSSRLLKKIDEPKIISNEKIISCNITQKQSEVSDFSEIMDLEEQIVGSRIPKENLKAIKSDENSDITGKTRDSACQTINVKAKLKNATEYSTRDKPDQVIKNIVYIPTTEEFKPKENPVGLVNVKKPDLVKEVDTSQKSIETKDASVIRQDDTKSNNSDTNKTYVSEQPKVHNKLSDPSTSQKDKSLNDPEKNIPLKLSDKYLDDESKPEQTSTQSESTKVNSLEGDTCLTPMINKKVSSGNDSEVICLDDGDYPPSVREIQPVRSNIVNDSTLSSKDKEVPNMESLSPELLKQDIKIENLPYPGPVDPLKKVVRITMPSGKAFKATIHGQINVDIDVLFSDPTLKSIIMNNISKKQKYSLNINHTGTLPLNNPRVCEIKKSEELMKNTKPVETIDLLSDSDDESPQVFTTEFGKFKVKAMEQTVYEKHQKRFKNRCVVTSKKLVAVSQIKEKQVDSSNAASMESACSKKLIRLESNDDILVHSEIIDLDDSSSNDELILPDLDIPASRKQTVTQPIQKINQLKKLLLNEFGFQDNVDDLNSNLNENLEIGSTVIRDSTDADVKITEKVITSAIEVTKNLEELVEVKSSQENTKHINTPISGDFNTKAPSNKYTKLPISTPAVPLDCFIKLTKCDNLVKKYEELKLLKKCSIKLARCDEYTKDDDKEINEPLEFLEESNDDIMDVVHLSRSGSFSILNDFAIFEEQDKATHLEQRYEEELRANSPVMQAYESIISSSFLQFNRQIKKIQKNLLSSEKNYCHSDWHYTKRNYCPRYKVNVTQSRGQNNTCISEWFSTKFDLHLLGNMINSSSYCKPEFLIQYDNYSGHADNDNDNVCDSILPRLCIVPSLKLILIHFLNTSDTLDQLIPTKVYKNTSQLTNRLTLAKTLKRRSSDTFNVKKKLPRKAVGNDIVHIESNDSNTAPFVIKIKCGEAVQDGEIAEDNNNKSQIVTDGISQSRCILTEPSSNSFTTNADDDIMELDSDSSKTEDMSETDSISILCETLGSNVDLITETHVLNVYSEVSNDMAFLSKNEDENFDIECSQTNEKQVEITPTVNIVNTDIQIDNVTKEVSDSNLLLENNKTHSSDDNLRNEKQVKVIDPEMTTLITYVDVECDQTLNMTNTQIYNNTEEFRDSILFMKNNETHCSDVDLADEKQVEVIDSEITNEMKLNKNEDLPVYVESDPTVNRKQLDTQEDYNTAEFSDSILLMENKETHCSDVDLADEKQVEVIDSEITNKMNLNKNEDFPVYVECDPTVNREKLDAQVDYNTAEFSDSILLMKNKETHCSDVDLADEKHVEVIYSENPNKINLNKNTDFPVYVECDPTVNREKLDAQVDYNTAEFSDNILLMKNKKTHCSDVDLSDEKQIKVIDSEITNEMKLNKNEDLPVYVKCDPTVNREKFNTQIDNNTAEVLDNNLLMGHNETHCSDLDSPDENQVEVINEMRLSKNEDLPMDAECHLTVNIGTTNTQICSNTEAAADSNLLIKNNETCSCDALPRDKQVELIDPEVRNEMTRSKNQDLSVDVDCGPIVIVKKTNTQIDNNTAKVSDSDFLTKNNETQCSDEDLTDEKQVEVIDPEITNEMTLRKNEDLSIDIYCESVVNMKKLNTQIYKNTAEVSDNNLLMGHNETNCSDIDLPNENQVTVIDPVMTNEIMAKKNDDLSMDDEYYYPTVNLKTTNTQICISNEAVPDSNLFMENNVTHCSNVGMANEKLDSKITNEMTLKQNEDIAVDFDCDPNVKMEILNTQIDNVTSEVSDKSLLMEHKGTYGIDVDLYNENQVKVIDTKITNEVMLEKNEDLFLDNATVNIKTTYSQISNNTEVVTHSNLFVKNKEAHSSDVDLADEKQVEVIDPEITNEMTLSKNENLSIHVECNPTVIIENPIKHKTETGSDSNLLVVNTETDISEEQQVEEVDSVKIYDVPFPSNHEDVFVDMVRTVDIEILKTDNNVLDDNMSTMNNETNADLHEQKVDVVSSEITIDRTLQSKNYNINADVIGSLTENQNQTKLQLVLDSDLMDKSNDLICNLVQSSKRVKVSDHEYTSKMEPTLESNAYINEEHEESDNIIDLAQNSCSNLNISFNSDNASITEEIVDMHSDEIIYDGFINVVAEHERLEKDLNSLFATKEIRQYTTSKGCDNSTIKFGNFETTLNLKAFESIKVEQHIDKKNTETGTNNPIKYVNTNTVIEKVDVPEDIFVNSEMDAEFPQQISKEHHTISLEAEINSLSVSILMVDSKNSKLKNTSIEDLSEANITNNQLGSPSLSGEHANGPCLMDNINTVMLQKDCVNTINDLQHNDNEILNPKASLNKSTFMNPVKFKGESNIIREDVINDIPKINHQINDETEICKNNDHAKIKVGKKTSEFFNNEINTREILPNISATKDNVESDNNAETIELPKHTQRTMKIVANEVIELQALEHKSKQTTEVKTIATSNRPNMEHVNMNPVVILEGIEVVDPVLGKYVYVFPGNKPITKASKDFAELNHVSEVVFDDEGQYIEVQKPKKTYSKNIKKDLTPPRKSARTLKRKSDMTDVRTVVKKYRKGKNIDYPKFTITSIRETAYMQEFQRLFDYCSTVKFSYSRPFHIECIDVAKMLKAWPINSSLEIKEIPHEKDENLFKDFVNNVTIQDPLQQTLADEIVTDYTESNYSVCKVTETNFNMGFGEGSGRVLQNLEEECSLKFSAATLSDVKQYQPPLLRDNNDHNATYQNQFDLINRQMKCIQMKNRIKEFFEKSMMELHDNSFKKQRQKDVLEEKVRSDFPYKFLLSTEFIQPAPIQVHVNVVQVGQLPVSAAAQNPVTCDPRVTQVSNVSPSQCSAENSPNDDPHSAIKTEYTELTTADFSLPLSQNYAQHIQSMQSVPEESHEMTTLAMGDIPMDDMRPVIKVELEEIPEVKQEAPDINEGDDSPTTIIEKLEPCDANSSQTSPEANTDTLYDSSEKSPASEAFTPQRHLNGSSEKTDQIAHAMNAAGIATSETMTNSRPHPLLNILNHKLRQGPVTESQSGTNTYSKPTSINAMSLQQALAHILPPPLNHTNVSENHQQSSSAPITQQVLHIVQSKNSSGNQITLVDNSQPSVINTPNSTPVLHIVQNKGVTNAGPPSNGTPPAQTNSFSGLSLVDAGIQQGNQLLHIVNTCNQKNANPNQLIKRVNLLTNLTNVQGSNEQKMVQFVCKSADGTAIQLNAPHQRSMVLRLQPYDTPNLQAAAKTMEAPDLSPTSNSTNNINKDLASQQEIKSRSIYEENYAKFIQNSSSKTNGSEKATSLPKFNQAFGKQVYQDGSQNKEISNKNSPHILAENNECQPNEGNINLEHISQINSPPLLLRKSPAQTSQPNQNLVQQIKQTIAPMNMTMHGGVIYTRQIPVNLGSGQTINLITVPSTELVDDSVPKPQADVKFINQNEMEQSIIKIVPQTQSAPSSENVIAEDNNANIVVSNEGSHSQPQQVLTQMRIKLPMLSKAPQMVSGARVVRPSFFQIQRNVIGGANQPVYQQLVLTAAPPLGQRLPQTQTTRQIKVPSESQSSSESMSSSTLEQLREFDLVLEQVKERSTVQPTPTSTGAFSKIHASSTDTTDSPTPSGSKPTESTQQVLYSIGNSQPINVAFVNRKSSSATPTPSTSSFVRSPDSSGINDSPTPTSHVNIPHTVTSEAAASSETPAQPKSSKSSSKSKSRPKASSNPPNTLKLNPVPPKTSSQKPLEDEQTTQRILYILAEYKEQVENSPDKDKPAPRRRTNPPSNPGSHKRKKCSGSSRRSGRDMSPIQGEDTSRTMGSEDSSCGTSQGDCNESCIDSHSPQDSPRKVVRKLTFENETNPINQPRMQPQRNVIVADGQTITVARGTAGKPATAVLMPANYILPVSMVKSGQQIAIVTNRGPKLLTVSGGEGGATNALLLQRLISPAGLKPMLARPGVRHVRLPTSALQNLHAFNLTSAVHPPDSTASPAPGPAPPELIETRANSSPWADRGAQDVKPERGSSPEGSEAWNLHSSADPHEYVYEETVRSDNMDRTVLDPIPDRYSPDMEAQRIFDKMFEVDSKKSYMVDSHDDSVRCGFDIDTSDCDDKSYHQVVHRKEGSTNRQHRLSHVSAAALRHKYAILEHELRLQKSLSEECEDLGVDSPSASELFPEAELLFSSSPAHDHTQEQAHHSHTPQPILTHSIPQPDLDDQIATDQLLQRQDDRDLGLGLEDVGIVTVSEDGMQATIQLDQEEFARSHPNTTFHSEPTEEGEVQPFTISSIRGRHITSTIFHANRTPGTVLMAPQTTVISQATPETSTQAIKYADLDNMINSLPPANNINFSSVLVKDDGGLRFDHILNDTRKLQLSHTTSTIVHSAGNATQVIRRVCYDDRARERDNRYLIDDSDAIIAGDDAKMVADDSIESMGGDVDDDRSSPERPELFWDSNSISERSESRRPLDFSSDSDKCCKSPSFDETNSTDSSGVGAHMRLDSVIKDARGMEPAGSDAPPLRTYPPQRAYCGERSVSGKTRGPASPGRGPASPGRGPASPGRGPASPGLRRRASLRGVVKRGCPCCNGSPAPPRPKKPRQRKPTVDFAGAD